MTTIHGGGALGVLLETIVCHYYLQYQGAIKHSLGYCLLYNGYQNLDHILKI